MSKLKKVDACIIGSGAGGSVVAKELGEHGMSVVVLEAGKRFNPLQDYNVSTSNEWERLGNEHVKKFSMPKMDTVTLGSKTIERPTEAFGVGGGTLRYLANYIRFFPDDFRVRSIDGVGFDWPITYQELAPYYKKVEMELGISGLAGGPWFPDITEYANPPSNFAFYERILEKSMKKLGIRLWPTPVGRLSRPFDGRPACVHCGRCMFGCMVRSKSSADVTFIAKAEATGKVEIRPESVVTQIRTDSGGKANSVFYVDKNGLEHEQEANVIIISAGSIQSPRLLLNSKSSSFPDGLANSSGMVGKNYMVHLYVESSALLQERVDSFRGFSNTVSLDFAMTNKNNPFVRGYYLKPQSVLTGPVMTAIHGVSGWGASHKKRMRNEFGHRIGISTGGENLPDEKNRVELDDAKVDHYGMPVPKLTFEFSQNDKMMMDAIEKKVHEIYTTANAVSIDIKKTKTIQTAHNMGTCRMGDDPNISVVNSFCQAHDVSNLFVVDASCFVTSGTANPSLTIQAIAKRSAEYIIEESKKGSL